MSNVAADLRLITVNDFARGHHQGHERPRRTDGNHRYDLLFKSRAHDAAGVTYEKYVPALHEVWELYLDNLVTTKSKLRTRTITTDVLEEGIKEAEHAAEIAGDFEFANEPDARTRVSP